MPATMRMLDVLIASPGDAAKARDVVERALHEWNNHRADEVNMLLRPRRWEMGAVPITGQGDAQSVINSQLVDSADIVIGIFVHRLGTATPRAVSGTAEEINRGVAAGKPVHLYFSERKFPYNGDLAQFQALRDFRDEMSKSGLIASFKNENKLSTMVARAIELDVGVLRRRPTTAGSLDLDERDVVPTVPAPYSFNLAIPPSLGPPEVERHSGPVREFLRRLAKEGRFNAADGVFATILRVPLILSIKYLGHEKALDIIVRAHYDSSGGAFVVLEGPSVLDYEEVGLFKLPVPRMVDNYLPETVEIEWRDIYGRHLGWQELAESGAS